MDRYFKIMEVNGYFLSDRFLTVYSFFLQFLEIFDWHCLFVDLLNVIIVNLLVLYILRCLILRVAQFDLRCILGR